ncbi:hypothetical protein Hanom_Chr09g00771471 [Helianthus anomalus]
MVRRLIFDFLVWVLCLCERLMKMVYESSKTIGYDVYFGLAWYLGGASNLMM